MMEQSSGFVQVSVENLCLTLNEMLENLSGLSIIKKLEDELLSERTFVMLKPETIVRCLVGRILQRIEDRNLHIVGLKILKLTRKKANELYKMHETKQFFNDLIEYITSGPVIVMVVEGLNVISTMRKLSGSTNPLEAEVGSIRGRYGLNVTKNVIHTADGYENAEREINLFFKPKEILTY